MVGSEVIGMVPFSVELFFGLLDFVIDAISLSLIHLVVVLALLYRSNAMNPILEQLSRFTKIASCAKICQACPNCPGYCVFPYIEVESKYTLKHDMKYKKSAILRRLLTMQHFTCNC